MSLAGTISYRRRHIWLEDSFKTAQKENFRKNPCRSGRLNVGEGGRSLSTPDFDGIFACRSSCHPKHIKATPRGGILSKYHNGMYGLLNDLNIPKPLRSSNMRSKVRGLLVKIPTLWPLRLIIVVLFSTMQALICTSTTSSNLVVVDILPDGIKHSFEDLLPS